METEEKEYSITIKEKVWTLPKLCLHQLRTLFIKGVDFKLHYNILNKSTTNTLFNRDSYTQY